MRALVAIPIKYYPARLGATPSPSSSSGTSQFTASAGAAAQTADVAANFINAQHGAAPREENAIGKFSRGEEVLGSALVTVGGYIATVPYVGTVIGGIVAAVGLLVGATAKLRYAISGTSKDKARLTQAGKYNEANGQVTMQIDQLDSHTRQLKDGLTKLNTVFTQFKLPTIDLGAQATINGLGGGAADILDNAKQVYDALNKELQAKNSYLDDLFAKISSAEQNLSVAVGLKKSTASKVLWTLGGMAVLGLTYYGYQKAFNKKKL